MLRRDFIRLSLGAAATAMLQLAGVGCQGRTEKNALMPPPVLPFDADALEPFISRQTVKFHFGKHHRNYVETANRLINETAFGEMPVEQIIRKSYSEKRFEQSPLFNNVAQAYNHAFYWRSLRPKGGGEPSGSMMEMLEASFGGYAHFRDAFETTALSRFASGWVWPAYSEGKLTVLQTANANTPLTMNRIPLLALDLWEHAYYLDYKNRRSAYVSACLDHLLNWEFAAENLGETA